MVQRHPWFKQLFGTEKPLIGVIHLAPLPGSPRHEQSFDQIALRAREDAECYVAGGVDGVIVENYGDAPFPSGRSEPHIIAAMTRISAEVREVIPNRPVGVNLLRNDAIGAMAVAVGAGLDFIRVNLLSGVAVTDQGLLEGDASELLRYRRRLGAEVRIFADFRVKHAAPLRSAAVEVEVDELVGRALADAVLVTGVATAHPPPTELLRSVREASLGAPVLVASGASLDNVGELAPYADGFVVGTSLKAGDRTEAAVDPAKVRRFSERLAGVL